MWLRSYNKRHYFIWVIYIFTLESNVGRLRHKYLALQNHGPLESIIGKLITKLQEPL